MGNVNEKVLDAMDILIDQSVNKASYNRTIQAQIISCEDATIGKYKCHYQDAIIYAYSENPDVTYNEKTFVYIDIPGNDMSKDKFIRGTSKRLGINYISQAEGDQAYDIIGTNCLTTNTAYYLYSICKDYKYLIYEYEKEASSNIQYDIQVLNQSIKESSSLIVGATFKTSLDPKQQYRGHYGITYNLCFFDNALNREVIRSYTVDEDNMVDNPYRLIYPTRQYEIFDIDGPNFDHIESIEIFCRDFPNAEKDKPDEGDLPDIEITNLELTGAVRMTDSEINGVAISFYTPQGIFFTDSDEESTEKVITAQVRIKGKLASSAQNIPFYWGIQNVGITPDSEYYNKYLGRGWRCLNDKNVIQTIMIPIKATDIFFIGENNTENYYYYKDKSNKVYKKIDENDNYKLLTSSDYSNLVNLELYYQKNNVLEWIPSKDTYIFNKNNATARDNKLKVAIVYDGTVVTKTITIQNLGKTVPILTIESSEGTQFYYDVGHPTLICKVNGEQDFSCRYQWSYEDRHGFGKISTEIAPCEDEIYFEQKEEKTNLKQYETDLKNIANALYSDQDEIKKELNNKINELEVLVERQKIIERKDNEIINELNTTTEESQQKDYIKMLAEAAQLQLDIINGVKYLNGSQKDMQDAINTIDDFRFKQRASGNKIYDVQIRNITSFKTFKCSVYNKDGFYLGTAAITLTNKLEGQDLYSLVINNGSVTFQYTEDGIAPTSKSLQNPQQIQALSFTVYDNLGNPIDSEVVQKSCEIEWRVPRVNTLIVDPDNGNGGYLSSDTNFICYNNKINLLYSIANGYNIQKQNNQIELTVKYNEMNLTTRTNFTFVKQGQPGTNGTQYVVKIVPNTEMNNPPLYPMITKIGTNEGALYRINYGISTEDLENTINTTTSYQLFKAQLWQGGQKVWEGFSAKTNGIDGYTKPTLVKWEVLQNLYNTTYDKNGNATKNEDTSLFTITDSSNGKIKYNGNNLNITANSNLANIIKCSIKWEDKTYYGTIPITNAWVADENYRIKLKDNTGFRYVIYTSDGVNPQYDKTNPFEFICEKKINNCWEDISLITLYDENIKTDDKNDYEIRYSIPRSTGEKQFLQALGTKKNSEGQLSRDDNSIYRKGCSRNQWHMRPISTHDGENVDIGIYCTFNKFYNNKFNEEGKNETSPIGRIHIPIHFLLNKYGMAHINEWDGNSVQINKDGGYILSPQMGAGTKKDNTFTGVLMGEVKEAGKSDKEIGLFGYASGARSFFLNSKNGSAIFGRNNSGQIIINPNPSQKRGMIYSGNFWETYNNDGLPDSYTYRNDKYKPAGNAKKVNNKVVGAGLLIDLTTPEIYFGNGNFYVTKDGYMHAAGGGDIAGWTIGTDKLTGGLLTLDSNGSIYAQSKKNGHNAIDATGNGFFLSGTGLSIGSRFKVTNNGVAYIGQNATENGGKKDAKGNPVTPNKYWTISGNDTRSYISYGGDVKYTTATEGQTEAAVSKVYLGTDGISLGKRFSVNSDGDLTAYSGTIGGWTIEKDKLSASNLLLKSSGDIQTNNYNATKNTGWKISQNGKVDFNSGTIGGWTINGTTLTGGNMTINSEGSISGDNWYIDKNGNANFSKLAGTVPSGYTLNLNGWLGGSGTLASRGGLTGNGMRLGGSGIGSYINPGTVKAGANTNTTLEGHFDTLYADKASFNTLSTKVADIGNAQITTADVKKLISSGTITFYDDSRPVTTTIPGIIKRIYSSISSLSGRISTLQGKVK